MPRHGFQGARLQSFRLTTQRSLKRCGNGSKNRISHGQCRFWDLLKRRVDMTLICESGRNPRALRINFSGRNSILTQGIDFLIFPSRARARGVVKTTRVAGPQRDRRGFEQCLEGWCVGEQQLQDHDRTDAEWQVLIPRVRGQGER